VRDPGAVQRRATANKVPPTPARPIPPISEPPRIDRPSALGVTAELGLDHAVAILAFRKRCIFTPCGVDMSAKQHITRSLHVVPVSVGVSQCNIWTVTCRGSAKEAQDPRSWGMSRRTCVSSVELGLPDVWPMAAMSGDTLLYNTLSCKLCVFVSQ
jgi:hypothetical protein